MTVLEHLSRWFVGASAPPRADRTDPYFRAVWEALERALAENRLWLADDEPPVFYEFVDIEVHPQDLADKIAPFKSRLDAVLQRRYQDMLRRLDYPPDAHVRVHLLPADMALAPVRRGQVRCVARAARPSPGSARAGQLVTDLGAPPTEPMVASAPSRTPSERLARLSWEEPSGVRVEEIWEEATFGRGLDATARLVSDRAGDDLHIVSRRALAFSRCPTSRRVRIENCGQVALAVEDAASAEVGRVDPGGRHALPTDARLVWPGQDGGRGFVLAVRTDRVAVATLASARGVQTVVLQEPGCEVVGDAERLGVDGVRFSVDFGGGELRVCNLGTLTSRIGDGDESRELMPADGQLMRFGPVRVQIHKEQR